MTFRLHFKSQQPANHDVDIEEFVYTTIHVSAIIVTMEIGASSPYVQTNVKMAGNVYVLGNANVQVTQVVLYAKNVRYAICHSSFLTSPEQPK